MEDTLITTPVVRPSTQPNNVKQEDSLLNKTEWTRTDIEALDRLLASYEATW